MKNLKYLFILILIFIMVPAANALTADELFEKESAKYQEHLEKINELAKENNLPEITFQNSTPKYAFDFIFDDKPITEHLSLKYWLYFVKNGYKDFYIKSENSTWTIGGGGTQGGFGSVVDTEEAGVGFSYPDNDGKQVYVDLSLYGICKTAAEFTENKAELVRYFSFDMHDYVYIVAGGEEYVIQYSSRPDFTGRENFKLYPFDEIFGEEKAKYLNVKEDEEIMGAGGESALTEDYTSKKDNSLIIWIASISAVVIIGIVIVLTLTKKRK